MQPAQFHAERGEAPPGGAAHWITARDGVRLRVGGWPGGARGTVLLLQGRAEWIEKYGQVAADLAARGYGTLAIDWRGQGLSQRLTDDPRLGHVGRFAEYQTDLAALLDAARALGLQGPHPVIAHSMGGCIALRALIDGLPISAVAFSAPMWGLAMARTTRAAAWSVSALARAVGIPARYAPGTSAALSVDEIAFDDNMLTCDRDSYARMQSMLRDHPELAVGGPSLDWLHAALTEIRALQALPDPATPAHIAVGTRDRIIDTAAVRARAAHWPGATLDVVEGAEHELLMEAAPVRARFLAAAAGLFDARHAAVAR